MEILFLLIIFLAMIFAMTYFLMIRPIQQRERKHDLMVKGVVEGDIVITAGGMYGEVESIEEDSVVLKVESGAKVRVTKGGILSKAVNGKQEGAT